VTTHEAGVESDINFSRGLVVLVVDRLGCGDAFFAWRQPFPYARIVSVALWLGCDERVPPLECWTEIP
jgi:hypothetical protein